MGRRNDRTRLASKAKKKKPSKPQHYCNSCKVEISPGFPLCGKCFNHRTAEPVFCCTCGDYYTINSQHPEYSEYSELFRAGVLEARFGCSTCLNMLLGYQMELVLRYHTGKVTQMTQVFKLNQMITEMKQELDLIGSAEGFSGMEDHWMRQSREEILCRFIVHLSQTWWLKPLIRAEDVTPSKWTKVALQLCY